MNKNKITAIIFLTILSFFSICTIYKVGLEVSEKIQNKVTTVHASSVMDEKNESTESTQSNQSNEEINSSSSKLKGIVGKVENLFNDNVFKKTELIEFNGLTQRLLGKNMVNDTDPEMTVIKDNDDFLYFITNDKLKDISFQANSIIELNHYCEKKGINFLYVQAPFKITGEEGQLPEGLRDYSNTMADNMLTKLNENEVNLLDLRQLMKEESLNYQEHFYKTDHHWTIETGFWAYGKLEEELNSKFKTKFNTKFYDLKNFKSIQRKKCFVGSQGTRVGKYFTDLDDITLYIPDFQTDYRFCIYDTNGKLVTERQGDFYHALVNTKDFESKDAYISKYDCFLETINEIRITNNISDNDLKVLFIKDSFAKPVAGYMSLNVKETRMLDLRTYKGSTYDYIEEYQPDIVIMLYNASFLKVEEYFNFES